jgi:hypothetical protein
MEIRSSRARPANELRIPNGRHICLLHQDSEERYRVLARFFAAALNERRKLLYITDTLSPEDARQRFVSFGADLRSASAAEVRTATDTYFPDGHFRPEVTCAALEDFARDAARAGFTGSRGSGEMDWASRGVPGAERLLEYEAMLTPVIERLPFSGICQYDVRLFDGPTILAILDLHPFMLVRGQVFANPNYVRRGDLRQPPLGRP